MGAESFELNNGTRPCGDGEWLVNKEAKKGIESRGVSHQPS